MTKLFTLIIYCAISYSVSAQTPTNVTVTEADQVDETTACDMFSLCTQEDQNERAQCIQEQAENNCNLYLDLEYIFSVLEKRKSTTTGIRNDEWRKLLKAIFNTSKLTIRKNRTIGVSFLVVDKKTGKSLIRIPLSRVNSKTFASGTNKKLNIKEINTFSELQKPTNQNALTIVSKVLKSCSISVSFK